MAENCYRFSVRDDTTWVCDGNNESSSGGSSEGEESSIDNAGLRIFHVTLNVVMDDMVPEQHTTLYQAEFFMGVLLFDENENQLYGPYGTLSEEIAAGVSTYNVIAYNGEAYIRLTETGVNYITLSNFSATAEEITQVPDASEQLRVVKLTGDASFTVTIGAHDEINE